jgi:hypothetical protein
MIYHIKTKVFILLVFIFLDRGKKSKLKIVIQYRIYPPTVHVLLLSLPFFSGGPFRSTVNHTVLFDRFRDFFLKARTLPQLRYRTDTVGG